MSHIRASHLEWFIIFHVLPFSHPQLIILHFNIRWYQNTSSPWPLFLFHPVSLPLHRISSYFTPCPWLTIAQLLTWPTGLSRCSTALLSTLLLSNLHVFELHVWYSVNILTTQVVTISDTPLIPLSFSFLLDSQLHSGHLADSFILSDLQVMHLSEERETTIYRCWYSQDVHKANCQALTIVRFYFIFIYILFSHSADAIIPNWLKEEHERLDFQSKAMILRCIAKQCGFNPSSVVWHPARNITHLKTGVALVPFPPLEPRCPPFLLLMVFWVAQRVCLCFLFRLRLRHLGIASMRWAKVHSLVVKPIS